MLRGGEASAIFTGGVAGRASGKRATGADGASSTDGASGCAASAGADGGSDGGASGAVAATTPGKVVETFPVGDSAIIGAQSTPASGEAPPPSGFSQSRGHSTAAAFHAVGAFSSLLGALGVAAGVISGATARWSSARGASGAFAIGSALLAAVASCCLNVISDSFAASNGVAERTALAGDFAAAAAVCCDPEGCGCRVGSLGSTIQKVVEISETITPAKPTTPPLFSSTG